MNGVPITKAKAAISRALHRLQPGDTFQIIRFSESASQLGCAPVPATAANVAAGLAWVRSLQGEGGTHMMHGISAALDVPQDPSRMRVVSFLTDGFIGNEGEILNSVRAKVGAARVFSFGVGSSPNRFLLTHMARLGRGAVAWVGVDDATGGEAVDAFYERLAHPALTDIGLEFAGWQVADVYPRRVPDVFVGRPVIVTGRYQGEPGDMVRVAGRLAGSRHEVLVPTDRSARAEHRGIPMVWARARIGDLYETWMWDANRGHLCQAEITRTALAYGLVSQWTSYVAVDASRITGGPDVGTVPVPVPLPAGMRAVGGGEGE